MSGRIAAWTSAAAAGTALAAAAMLLSRWCADTGLGLALVLSAALAGAAVASLGTAPSPGGARAWAAGAALAALGVPALLRFLGLATATAERLEDPLGGAREAAFVLGQAWLLAAAAAAAWARSARGEAIGRAAVPLGLAGAAAAWAGARRADSAVLLACAALARLALSVAAERPWGAAGSLRARAFGAASFAGLLLAGNAPRLLKDVWTARLNAAYPGGAFLAYGDDGSHAWATYQFSPGHRVRLRDGVPQTEDAELARQALRAIVARRRDARSVRIEGAFGPSAAIAASDAGLAFMLGAESRAQAKAADALAGAGWRKPPEAPAVAGKPDAVLLVLPRPLGALERRRLAGAFALRSLRETLSPGGAAGILIPPEASTATVSAVRSAAAAAFGLAETAELPRGKLVVAAPSKN